MRLRYVPWFAPTFGERCWQAAQARHRRDALDVVNETLEEMRRTGEPPADLVEHFRRWDSSSEHVMLDDIRAAFDVSPVPALLGLTARK